jgi:deoxycytidylate deaminase
MAPQIIGLTGSFGSGCSYVAENILSGLSYKRISLSEILRAEYRSEKGFEGSNIPRQDLQDFGDAKRKEKGMDYYARKAYEEIEYANNPDSKWAIESIRNPDEIHFFREKSQRFFLFGVYATKEKRWDRVRTKPIYNGDKKKFEEDDDRDTGRESPPYGQRVEDCFAESDVVVSNEDNFALVGNTPFKGFQGKIENFVQVISKPLTKRQPTQVESLMAAAYTMSQRSSCLKRKVGAVIVDDEGNIVSSGFNEVPRHGRPCFDDYKKCGRTVFWEDFAADLKREYPNEGEKILKRFRQRFRILDNCRSLHAEENAIINLARNGGGVSLDRCTLYTTTYPCRLCANKIVNLGIKRVIYLEPYPDPEAKVILEKGGPKDEFFEGITFKAYSRVYGEKK